MILTVLMICCMLLSPASGLELVSALQQSENVVDTALMHIAQVRGVGLITPDFMPKHWGLYMTAGNLAGLSSSPIQLGPFFLATPMNMQTTNSINNALQDTVNLFLPNKAEIVFGSIHDAFVRLRVFHSYLNKAVVVLFVLKFLCNFSSRLLLFGRSFLRSCE